MKKIMATMLGLTLALGSATLFAQEGKTGDTKTAEKAPKTAKTKRAHKKHAAKTKAAGSETAPAADTTKK